MTSPSEILGRLHHDPAPLLRTIKNSLTGRDLRKIEYIEAGLIPALDDLLRGCDDQHHDGESESLWSDAAAIVGMLANSGTHFVAPILARNAHAGGSLIARLMERVQSNTGSPKSQLAFLQCFNNMADNLPLETMERWNPDPRFANQLYSKHHAAFLVQAVESPLACAPTQAFLSQRVAQAALCLVSKTCSAEKHKALLIEAGMLTALAGHVVHFRNLLQDIRHTRSQSPPRASPMQLALTTLVLENICLLTEHSAAHMRSFISHDVLASIFANTTSSEWSSADIPHVPDTFSYHAARRSNFPPLGYAGYPAKRRASSMRHDSAHALVIEEGEQESSLDFRDVSWLLYISRTYRGRLRVVAARLVAILKNHGLLHPARIRSLGALLVPVMVEMIGTGKSTNSSAGEDCGVELVPSTLALVVRDNEHLEDAAVDAKAIPKLAAALKANFEAKQDLQAGLWWPQKLDHDLMSGERPRCFLGPGGPSKQFRLNMLHREGILQALASLTPTKDIYRKEVCDQGALVQIMLALEPFQTLVAPGPYGEDHFPHGNSTQAIVAACGAVRALTRSATALRTKLVDAEVAKSIVRLLETEETDVRIAATMVMANLAHDFSPMKTTVGERSVVRILCRQAHSANARLRHESLFALKALVNNSNNALKRQIVDELGPSWIKQLIATDPHDVPHGEVIGLVPSEYRKGSMLRVSDDAVMLDAEDLVDEIPGASDFTRHTLQQDLAIQSELLAFLRNLTAGENVREIIEYLLEHIGQEDFLQIIQDRLHSSSAQKLPQKLDPLLPPPETLAHSLFILAHLCAADQRYRTDICFNTALMKQTISQLHSSASLVRVGACWLIINLIYPAPPDAVDQAVQRARELQKLGIVSQLRQMEANDSSADVVERVKTALDCFGRLLDRG